jgi:UDP-glucose 4-epimerase
LNILATGGAGFIGSHVVDACINEGHYVVVIDDCSTGRRENVNPGAEFIQLDIRSGRVGNVFEDTPFDAVIHHAAQMDVRKSVADPLSDAGVNILGTLNLLANCAAHRVGRFIFASTGGAIYGEQVSFPADENHPLNPVSPYGVSKLAAEKYLHYFQTAGAVKCLSLRYGNVYGPRQNPDGEAGVIAIFAKKLLAGTQPLIHGDGKQTRDYVYVDDVVKSVLLALPSTTTGAFNIGTGTETTVNQVFAILRELTGSEFKETHGPAKAGEQRRSVLECSAAKRALGWTPQTPLKDGLARTVEFFRGTGS